MAGFLTEDKRQREERIMRSCVDYRTPRDVPQAKMTSRRSVGHSLRAGLCCRCSLKTTCETFAMRNSLCFALFFIIAAPALAQNVDWNKPNVVVILSDDF